MGLESDKNDLNFGQYVKKNIFKKYRSKNVTIIITEIN